MKDSIDGIDLIICVSLWGGFMTGIWSPAVFFSTFALTLAYMETRNQKTV